MDGNGLAATFDHRIVQSTLLGTELANVVREARDPDSAVGVRQARQETNHVDERLADDTSLHSRVKVGLVAVDLKSRWKASAGDTREKEETSHLDRRVDDSSKTESEAGNVLADPVRVADEDHIDIANEVLETRNVNQEASLQPLERTRFFRIASWNPALPVSSSPSTIMTRSTSNA